MNKHYKIPVVWQMYGHITVQAVDLDEALDKAAEAALPTDGSYIEGSFEIDHDAVEDMVNDGLNSIKNN